MSMDIRVDISQLSEEDEHYSELLRDFLINRMDIVVEATKDQVLLTFERGEESLGRPRRIRQLLKKFLHRRRLKEEFRVISGGQNAFIISRRRKRDYY